MAGGHRTWRACPDALELLDDAGGPFDHAAWRRGWTEAYPDWRDASFGGETASGTRAAVALLQAGDRAESIPNNYGTLVATRPLGEHQVRSFLEAARAACGAARLYARTVPLRPTPLTCHVGATVAGWTSVVYIEKGGVLEPRYAQKARRSIRKAERAGAEGVATRDPGGFLPLYAAASADHWMRYPESLVRSLAGAGAARFFDVRLGSDVVASVMALTSGRHWVAWLAAQDERGRSIDANYFAVGRLLAAAGRDRVPAVNFGISQGMPGVARFKRRFDAIEVPVLEYRIVPWTERARLRARGAARRGVDRARRLLRRP